MATRDEEFAAGIVESIGMVSDDIAQSLSHHLGVRVTPSTVASVLTQGVLVGVVLTLEHGRYADKVWDGAEGNPAYQNLTESAVAIADLIHRRNPYDPAALTTSIGGPGYCEVCHENRAVGEAPARGLHKCARCMEVLDGRTQGND